MVAAMSVMSVVAAVVVAAAVVMVAATVTAIGAVLPSGAAIYCQRPPSHLQGISPQNTSVANACASYFHSVANAGQKILIFQKL